MQDRCTADYKQAYQQTVQSCLQRCGLPADLAPAERAHVQSCYRNATPAHAVAVEIKVRREITAVLPTFFDK